MPISIAISSIRLDNYAGIRVLVSLLFANSGAGVANVGLSKGVGAATFTRATTAWTKLSTGLWSSVASGQPRYCFTGLGTTVQTQGGYFSEIASTQIIPTTAAIRDMTDLSWVKTNTTAAKTATGIDGVANSASTITALAISGMALLTITSAATTRVYSLYIKRRTGTGTITINNGIASLDVTALINSTTYTKVQVTGSDLNPAIGLTIATLADAVDVDFNQYETGTEATSPIDVGGATRNTDVLTYQTAGNIEFAKGAVIIEAILNDTVNALSPTEKHFVAVTGAALPLYTLSASAYTSISEFDSTTTNTKPTLTNLSTAIRKRGSSWGALGQNVTGDGAVVATAAFDGTMGSTGVIAIGNGTAGTNAINGIIKSVTLHNSQLSNAALQLQTT